VCRLQFDNADDKKKELERAEGQLMASTAGSKESTATLADENKTFGANINDLDNMAVATDNRKEENYDFNTLVASDAATKEILVFSKQSLNKFHDAKMYKPEAKMQFANADDRTKELERAEKENFDMVIKMAHDMVALRRTEQLDDNDKKEFFEMQFDNADDKKTLPLPTVAVVSDPVVCDLDMDFKEFIDHNHYGAHCARRSCLGMTKLNTAKLNNAEKVRIDIELKLIGSRGRSHDSSWYRLHGWHWQTSVEALLLEDSYNGAALAARSMNRTLRCCVLGLRAQPVVTRQNVIVKAFNGDDLEVPSTVD